MYKQASWIILFVTVSCVPPSFALADESMQDSLSSAKRIVFLGDSVTYAGGYVTKVSVWLKDQRKDDPPILLNLGLPSETVSGLSEQGHAGGRFPRPVLHERLARVLDVTQPDLVIACYGINCGIYQPWDPSRFAAYQKGMRQLHRQVEQSGARIIHVTPPSFDAERFKGSESPTYNEVLHEYSKWLLEQRESGWWVLDLHGPMTAKMMTLRPQGLTLQPDGVHPNPDGHAFIAKTLLDAMGAPDDWQPKSKEQVALESKRMNLLRNAYLSAAGHLRPGIPEGLPIADAEKQAAAMAQPSQP